MDEANIFDYLNEDCLKAVLDFIPVEDIIRTERVCHRWQEMVQAHLRRIRFGIGHFSHTSHFGDNERNLTLNDNAADLLSFERWTNKLGPSVVSTFCSTDRILEVVGENCPNLEALMLLRQSDQQLLNKSYENFKWLRRIYFQSCNNVSDHGISRFIKNNNCLEELQINCNNIVTGKFLSSIKSAGFESLIFNECKALEMCHLLSVASSHNLTKLELVYVPRVIYTDLHILLDKVPKLEHLRLFNCGMKCEHFFKAVCQLTSLKRLYANLEATDVDLEDVTRCCKELTSLELGDCSSVTKKGLAAVLRNAGPRLITLGVPSSDHLTDDDVISCINGCPNLIYLDVGGIWELTESLLPRAAAARRAMRTRPALRLRLASTDLEASDELGNYEELELEF